ncbi:hypothetical protein NP493_47g02019 [Ridgeia piscesae]|uniref:Uncharacterized protein n=1 Tax=Ridgeia piscesae TaxID=27915 RepID=A0AAD9UJD2_RIDPI|nr:hypothetical protein NP493_47g02019 [Ridgeia piscesae]
MHQGWGTRDASRYNRALIGRGMNQHRQGDSNVHYDETGRVVYQGRRRPDDTLPEPHRDNRRQQSQRRDDYRPREPSSRDRRREPSYRDHNRPPMDPYSRGGRPAPSDYSRGGRQYDNGGYRPEPQQQIRGGGHGGYAGKDYYEDRGYSEYTDETRANANDDIIGPRFIGIAFIGLGILLLGLAVVEVMLCLEHEYYCLFWTGALVFEFGMFIFIHNGDYHKTWKNVLVLSLGLLAGVAVHVSVALVMSPLAREFLTAGRASNSTEFEALWHKISFQTNKSNVDISNTTQPWVCIGIDGSSMFVLMVSFLTLTAAAVMANRIYRYIDEEDDNDEYIFGLCRPKLFNPYGQLSAAQALSFVGIVTVYGTMGTDWNDYWAPVWTAGLVGIAAITNVAALKREELLHLSGIALVFQVLSVCGCVATVVLSTMGLVDDVKLLDKPEYTSGFDRNHIIASGCLFALVDVVALVNSFFGVGLTVRLFDNLYRSSPADGDKRPYSEGASSYDDDPSPARDQRHLTPHTNNQGYDPRWDDKRGARY